MHSVALAHATDFEGFRAAARSLLAHGVRPEDVTFSTGAEPQSLFADAPVPLELHAAMGAALKVPRAFVELARKAAMHRDPLRFAVLYRLLWRLRDEPRLLDVDFDQDVAAARVWQKAVERDIHKMHAYVRFRTVKGVAPPTFVAWFEPAHHIVEEAAAFFVRRFPNVRWTIVTPETTATWDTEVLRFGAGGRRADAPAFDAAEDLWRSYYSSIFNPARLNVRAMRSHMPQKYWRNLPESAAIKELVRAAEPRTRAMIESAATEPPKHHRAAAQLARRGGLPAQGPPPRALAGETLAELAAHARGCRGCGLWRNATQTVFGEGPADARVVFVGEQPGDQEDLKGAPFVGPAGKLLDRALRDADVDRRAVYLTNAVKHFKFEPRGKRRLHKTPAQLEVLACRAWLERELALIRPKLVVALGATAAGALLRRQVAVQSERGTVIECSELGGAACLITVHPSFLLRLPEAEKAVAYRGFVADLTLVGRYLAGGPAERDSAD